MSYATIPLPSPSQPSIKLSTALDGVTFFLALVWNERDGRWYLDVSDYAEEPIIEGVRVVVGWPLLKRVVDTRRPAGDLIAIDLTGAREDPGEDWGERWRLVYVDAASRAEAAADA
jgi:hypothetical protein